MKRNLIDPIALTIISISSMGGVVGEADKMKTNYGWTNWNNDANGNNESGFSALPGGARRYLGGFAGIGEWTTWWTDEVGHESGGFVWCKVLTIPWLTANPMGFSGGAYVRCVKD
jgi:uncharacterized protein (TIGR02145 family)